MNKERLEEIKQRLVLLHNAADVDNETKSYIFEYLKVEWLIERVQELEQELHFCKVTKLSMDSVEKYTSQLKKQNKRYREALEFIGNHANESELMDNTMYTELVKEIIEKALEDEE